MSSRQTTVDRKKILVIGSFMMDMVVRTPRAPEDGETIIGYSFSRHPGGKGANQAVSAARLGGDVTMVGKVGEDKFGDEFLDVLTREKINTRNILRDPDHPTGVGMITVEDNGNNRIIVVPGANLMYTAVELEQIKDRISQADIILVQLEMDTLLIEEAVSLAVDCGIPVILNPAPARELSDELLSKTTYLVPNETEVEILTGIKVESTEEAELAAKMLWNKGVGHVVITLGEKGSLVTDQSGTHHIPGFPVKPVDTVGAGDAFNGALAIGITQGKPLKEVVTFANAVGALAITNRGGIPSMPHLTKVHAFLSKHKND